MEILPGFFSWTLILFPIWGSLTIPYVVAYFIIFFDVYWLYKSFSVAITAFLSSNRIKEAESKNWLEKSSILTNFDKVNHIIIIPNYKEGVEKLRATIKAIAGQTFPTKRIFVILAMEKREHDGRQKANMLMKDFEDTFGGIFATYHPDREGEVKGKSSNEAYGGKQAYDRLIKNGLVDMDLPFTSPSLSG